MHELRLLSRDHGALKLKAKLQEQKRHLRAQNNMLVKKNDFILQEHGLLSRHHGALKTKLKVKQLQKAGETITKQIVLAK